MAGMRVQVQVIMVVGDQRWWSEARVASLVCVSARAAMVQGQAAMVACCRRREA
jgi:heme A synthase